MQQNAPAIKTEIVRCFQKLYAQGTVNLFEGNLSVRAGDRIYMTPSQQNKETMTPEMILTLSPEGALLHESVLKPSSETPMHLALYRLRPDIGAIVHTHSACAAAFALAGQDIETELAEQYLFFKGSIPCCAYGTPGTDAVFQDFARYFKDEGKNAVLLANHGLVTAGNTLEEAFARAEAAEKIAKIALMAKLLGKEQPLPEGEKERLAGRG